MDKPDITDGGFNPVTGTIDATEGEDLSYMCAASGTPSISYVWSKDGKKFDDFIENIARKGSHRFNFHTYLFQAYKSTTTVSSTFKMSSTLTAELIRAWPLAGRVKLKKQARSLST